MARFWRARNGPGVLGEQVLRQDQVAPANQQEPAQIAFAGRDYLPVFRAEALLNGGKEQGVFQRLAPLEQEELAVVGEGPDNPAIGEEKIVLPGIAL